ncbi:MAG: HD domain-containing protein, partial [Candidatus Pacebacteria bacterium]|nr:HD domain-containing protein [Candidatus Paceibacterota bacterium]
AIAYDIEEGSILDLYKGQNDIKDKVVKTVGNPDERFREDALRLLRSIRLSAELGFEIEKDTRESIEKNSKLLANISKERISEEFEKIIKSENPEKALEVSRETGILTEIIPELLESVGIEQGGAHKYDVWEHLIKSMMHAVKKDYPFHVKLAALFHDIGKPRSRRKGAKKTWTFYGHEVIGAKMAKNILERLHFSRETIEKVTKLVRWHMFFADTEQISQTAIRRMIRNVGKDMIWELMDLRVCDRIGMGRPKEDPYRLRKYHSMIEEVMSDPVSVGMLKIDGNQLISEFHMEPGPKIGYVLHALLEEVIEDPKKNREEYLKNRVEYLMNLTEEDLKSLGEAGKSSKEAAEEAKIQEIRKKHFVD